jgi:hypothetical protein
VVVGLAAQGGGWEWNDRGIKSADDGVGRRLHSISGRNECKMLDWISVYGQKEVQFAEG